MFKKYLTFDDVLLLPNYSEVLPSETTVKTRLTKNIYLNIPIISAAMDTVTESKMAIEMARNGGIGIIHKNMSIEEQVEEVKKVKRYNEIFTYDVVTVLEDDSVEYSVITMEQRDVSSVIVTDKDNHILGIFTKRDLKYVKNYNDLIKDYMSKNVYTLSENVTVKEAYEKIYETKVSKLPVVDKDNKVIGLVSLKHLNTIENYKYKSVAKDGSLLVGAAVSINEKSMDKVEKLYKAGIDVLVIDSAHGHSKSVIELTKEVKSKFKDLEVIVGNVVTEDGVEALCKAGADAIKVGIGSGSICTTRIISGVGAPQLTAILDSVKAAKKYNVPIISDGGIKYSGDIMKALAAGAESVVLGSLLAGHDQSPGEIVVINGKKYKSYVGMGSMAAMNRGGGDRYFQSKVKKYVPEGVEAFKEYKGDINKTLYQLIGGVKSGMGYNGAKDLDSLKKNARFIEISHSSQKESHPHSISNVESSPNYNG